MRRSNVVRACVAVLMAAGFLFVGANAASAAGCGYSCPTTGGTVTFTIDDTTVVAGQTVGVSGTGCAAGADVTFTIGGTEVGSTTADSDGNYSGSVTIPNLDPGEYTINATCGSAVLGITITVGSGAGGTGSTTGGGLARTGSDLGPLAGLGAAAVVLGGAAVYGTRRRRQTA